MYQGARLLTTTARLPTWPITANGTQVSYWRFGSSKAKGVINLILYPVPKAPSKNAYLARAPSYYA